MIAVLCIGFMLVGVLLISGDPLRPSQLRRITQTGVGILSILFGLFGLGVLAMNALRGSYRQPIIKIDESGIHDYQNDVVADWDDIERIKSYANNGQKGIEVYFSADNTLNMPHIDINLMLASQADFERAVEVMKRQLSR